MSQSRSNRTSTVWQIIVDPVIGDEVCPLSVYMHLLVSVVRVYVFLQIF